MGQHPRILARVVCKQRFAWDVLVPIGSRWVRPPGGLRQCRQPFARPIREAPEGNRHPLEPGRRAMANRSPDAIREPGAFGIRDNRGFVAGVLA